MFQSQGVLMSVTKHENQGKGIMVETIDVEVRLLKIVTFGLQPSRHAVTGAVWVRCGPSGLACISTAPVGQQKMHRLSDYLHTGYPTVPRLSDAGHYGLAGVGLQVTCTIPVGTHGSHPGTGYVLANPACKPCIILVTGIIRWPGLCLTNHE